MDESICFVLLIQTDFLCFGRKTTKCKCMIHFPSPFMKPWFVWGEQLVTAQFFNLSIGVNFSFFLFGLILKDISDWVMVSFNQICCVVFAWCHNIRCQNTAIHHKASAFEENQWLMTLLSPLNPTAVCKKTFRLCYFQIHDKLTDRCNLL